MIKHPEQTDFFIKEIIPDDKEFNKLTIQTTQKTNEIIVKSTRFKRAFSLNFVKMGTDGIPNRFIIIEKGNEIVYRDKWVTDEVSRMLRLAKQYLIEGKFRVDK